MVYPILFPRGEHGYDYREKHTYAGNVRGVAAHAAEEQNDVPDFMPLEEDDNRVSRKYVTIREFYRYRLQVRDEFSIIHNAGELFQQYLVDAWVRAESNELWYLRQNQKKLHIVNRKCIHNFIKARADEAGAKVGRVTILPTTFTGGPRDMNRKYLDAMTIISRHGKPDLFITFTCNPRWTEITENLEYKQKYEHRPDLVCRVFHAKLLELIDDIANKQIFGVILNYMYVIEFQKRGLPHAHIIVTLRPEDKLLTESDIDGAISAMLPDKNTEQRAFDSVIKHCVHRPCGPKTNPNAPCMRDGECSKRYPKEFCEKTRVRGHNKIGQPDYKRPLDGRQTVMDGSLVDNRRIVPHNKYLLAKFDSHINVECCGTLGFMKYLFKYVEKGPNYVSLQAMTVDHGEAAENAQNPGRREKTVNWDEITSYQNFRYVSSPEATWKILQFPMSDRSHAVLVLPVHLHGEQDILIAEDETNENILQACLKSTKLIAWFKLNSTNPIARRYLYAEIPEHFVWDNKQTTWNPRKQVSKTLGCLTEVSLLDREKYYLRMLLAHVRGATSYESLRTVDGVVHNDNESACRAMHHLINNDEYDKCMKEACGSKSPFQLRNLFALICSLILSEGSSDQIAIQDIWTRHKSKMSEDFVHRDPTTTADSAESKALYHLKILLIRLLKRNISLEEVGLSDVDINDPVFADVCVTAVDISRANRPRPPRGLTPQASRDLIASKTTPLNEGQNYVFRIILDSLRTYTMQGHLDGANMFFVDGPGGTGKTFMYNVIIDVLQNVLGSTIISVAWTAVAATLLENGKTVHSAFRLPIKLTSRSMCGHPLDSDQARVVKNASVIIWDEAPMSTRHAIEAVDRYLRILMAQPDKPMGGKIVIFGGDFRQLLPVVPGGHAGEVIEHSIISSPLWTQVKILKLRENMRARLSPNATRSAGDLDYPQFLLKLGGGSLPYVQMPTKACPNAPKDLVEIPKCILAYSRDELLDFTFEGTQLGDQSGSRRAILSPTNRVVDLVNNTILSSLPGTEKVFYSVDEYEKGQLDDLHVPMDYLNSINIASLPPHELKIKEGAVVMMISNLNVEEGLCNGVRMKVCSIGDDLIEVEKLDGSMDIFLLPRVKCRVSEGTNLPGNLVRFQFPIRLAFGMTINKAQGRLSIELECFWKNLALLMDNST